MLTHVILEVVCTLGFEHDDLPVVPGCCRNGAGKPGVHCLLSQCPNMGFTDAPHELAFSDANGEIDIFDEANWVGFGGDMEPGSISDWARNELMCLWERISKKKIKEAYLEYLEQMKNICDIDGLIDRMRRQPHGIRMDEAHKVLLAQGYRPDGQKGTHRRYVDASGGVITVKDENPLKAVYVKDILRAVYLKDIASRIEGGAST